jgi:PelA/Pel-15E family pectate lyase
MRLALILIAVPIHAAVIGASVPAESLTLARIANLPPAQQAAWKAYLDRSARQSRTDRDFLQSELKSGGLAAPTIPPSSNATRSIPLDKPADWYATPEARRIAEIVVSFQTPAGGWSKNLNLADHIRHKGEHFAPNNLSLHLSPGDFDTPHDAAWSYVGTLDNDATTTEIQFLARVATAAPKDSAPFREAALRGIDYLFAAQFPNGGWPQVWPLDGGYHDAVTFNDGAVTLTLDLLQDVADARTSFAFVPETVRIRARGAVARGIECILATQISANGHRTVWGQQHDPLTLLPVSARNYEPAVQCAAESAALITFLMRLPKPSPAVIQAVDAAAAWLHKVAIEGQTYQRGPEGRRLIAAPGAPLIWSRFYQTGTDRPIFGDRDKSLHDDVNELTLERRNGYSWYNAAPAEALTRYTAWSHTH